VSAFCTNDVSPAVRPCASQADDHWIEIVLVHEDDGSPVAGEEYCVTLPDGVECRGFLDGNGSARITGIDEPGACKVHFPQLDKDAWKDA
jgi:hypothetical protein